MLTQLLYFIIVTSNSNYIPKAAISHGNYSWRRFVSVCSTDWIFIRRIIFRRISVFNWLRLLVASLSPSRPRVQFLTILYGIWNGIIGKGMGCLPDYHCFYLTVPVHLRFIITFVFILLVSEGQAGEAWHIDALSQKENVSVLKD